MQTIKKMIKNRKTDTDTKIQALNKIDETQHMEILENAKEAFEKEKQQHF